MYPTRMGANEESVGFWSVLPWALIGGAAGWGLYMLLKPKAKETPKPGETQAAPVAPTAPPSRFADLESVKARFAEVKELYRMGYLNPSQTISELDGLTAAADTMVKQGADASAGADLTVAIAEFRLQVEEYIASQSTGLSSRFRVVNL